MQNWSSTLPHTNAQEEQESDRGVDQKIWFFGECPTYVTLELVDQNLSL